MSNDIEVETGQAGLNQHKTGIIQIQSGQIECEQTETEFNAKWNKGLAYAQMGEVLEKSPVVIIHALVLQDKQLAHVPGSDVTRNLYRSAAVVFIINFDYLQEKHNGRTCQRPSSGDTLFQHLVTGSVVACRHTVSSLTRAAPAKT